MASVSGPGSGDIDDVLPPSSLRTKQACEPCRRKKTKCPGQKPICSNCRRLGQHCTYVRSESHAGVVKSQVPVLRERIEADSRIQRLESRIEQIYGVIDRLLAAPSSRDGTANGLVDANSVATTGESQPDTLPNSEPEPSGKALENLLYLYKEKLDFQPLSLFEPDELEESDFISWPRYLRQSFLAVTIPLTSSLSFAGEREEAVKKYSRSARGDVLQLAMDGECNCNILRALCLLTLSDITSSRTVSATLNISLGLKLARSTGMMARSVSRYSTSGEEAKARCCWSLYMLDRMYGCNLSEPPAISDDDMIPVQPQGSVKTPQGTDSSRVLEQGGAIQNHIHDLGITTYCLQLLSVWSDTMSYLKNVKLGRAENAWESTSQYSKISARLYHFETKLAQSHRFQNLNSSWLQNSCRQQNRQYWNRWLTMQFLFHGIQGLINHPFLFIHGKQSVFHPPSFMQNSVDQAILHAAWIVKLINTCNEQHFTIHDPFLGHLASITATVFLFLLNAKDLRLASQASIGYDCCHGFVARQSEEWKHLHHTIEKLDILHSWANPSSTNPAPTSAPKAQTSLLWELMDYSLSTRHSNKSDNFSDVIDLTVTTSFLSPVNPLDVSDPIASGQETSDRNQCVDLVSSLGATEPLLQPAVDADNWNFFDIEQMADFTNSTLGRDLLNLGHL